jgi:hypothetical protein
MPKGKEILLMAGASVCCLLFTATIYMLFQNKPVYDATLGHITNNYRNDGNRIYKDHVPYEQFAESKMYSWDAALYRKIADNGYSIQAAGGDYIFAFFPLFPYLWKLSGLNAIQISLLNYFFYVVSLIILISLFIGKDSTQKWRYLLVMAGIPMLVVFMIPYTEGLFMFTMTLALWGIFKNRYLLYFTGALLASMTRQSVSILVLTFFFTEFYSYVLHRQLLASCKSFLLRILPLITGVIIVSLIQRSYGSPHPAMFIEVEKYWGFRLQWPGAFTDWAQEQYCTNLPLMLLILPVLLVFLSFHTLKTMFGKNHQSATSILPFSASQIREYLFILSSVYIVGMCLTLLVLKGGALNGLSRFVFCTPFFSIFLFMIREKIARANTLALVTIFGVSVILSMLAFNLSNYSASWNFSDLGFFLFFFQIAFFIFTKMISNNWAVAVFAFLTALWTSYLFSMFVSNAWIFT